MKQFRYEGIDVTGAQENGVIDASHKKLAFDLLSSRGITVFNLSDNTNSFSQEIPWYRRDITFFGNQLSFDEQAKVAMLLATLFEAGLPVTEVVRITILSTPRSEVRKHFERVEMRIADGASFAAAFDAENKKFSPMFVSFLKVSDTANVLPALLKELAVFFRKQNEIRQKISSAIIYPAILIAAAMALLFVVIFYLAPSLAQIFSSVDKEPPFTLSVLLNINHFLRENWLVTLGSLVGMVMSVIALSQLTAVKTALPNLLTRVPIFGKLMLMSKLGRLSLTTKLLLTSGQTLTQALRTSATVMASNTHIGAKFHEAADALEEGGTASSVFDDDLTVPPIFKELLRVGEQTNNLPSTLSAVSQELLSHVETRTQRLLSLLTPALTLILGLGIGFLIYTMMGAILEVNELAF